MDNAVAPNTSQSISWYVRAPETGRDCRQTDAERARPASSNRMKGTKSNGSPHVYDRKLQPLSNVCQTILPRPKYEAETRSVPNESGTRASAYQ